ncbi:MAG TPA: methionine synthase [Methanospirillum sp.]|nr:methionine synthase [Methanospirillum sp.]
MESFLPGILLPTTVVGSFPAEPRRTLRSLFDPWHEAVCTSVDAQIAAGISIISDGQVRGDMIGSFASMLPGIRGKDVIGRVMPADMAITIRDTRYALTRHPHVKGIITGPSTLSYGLHLASANYRGRDELIPDIAYALRKEAESLASLGITVLQIDEPIFSTGTADLDLGREAIELITRDLDVPVCMHVCGPLSRIIDDILKIPIDILDFEGSVDPDNLSCLSSQDLGSKYVGLGCVDSSRSQIEEVSEISTRIRKGVDELGPERLLLDPDCGLRMLPREVAEMKLIRLCEAAGKVRQDL